MQSTLNPSERIFNCPIPIVGLSGGIATGKSTVVAILRKHNILIIDADQLVKEIYTQEITKNFIKNKYPQVWTNSQIDFKLLRELFFNDNTAKTEIEAFILSKLPSAFNQAYLNLNNPSYVVFDAPILFELGLHSQVDYSVLVYAPRTMQKQRLVMRDNISSELAETILKQQMDIEAKKPLADLIIDNSQGLTELEIQTNNLINKIKSS